MNSLRRFCIWAACATLVGSVDLATKAAPHRTIATNTSHAPVAVYLAVGAFLLGLGIVHSPLVSIGAGLMFGALCGNIGELLVTGFATDWIQVGNWYTNVADISGAAGLVLCVAGFVSPLLQSYHITRR